MGAPMAISSWVMARRQHQFAHRPFDRSGKFIKTWGRRARPPGQEKKNRPFASCMDSRADAVSGDRQKTKRIRSRTPRGKRGGGGKNFLDQLVPVQPAERNLHDKKTRSCCGVRIESVSKTTMAGKRASGSPRAGRRGTGVFRIGRGRRPDFHRGRRRGSGAGRQHLRRRGWPKR